MVSDGVVIAALTACASVLVAGLAAWAQRKPAPDRRKTSTRRSADQREVDEQRQTLEAERTAFREEIRNALMQQIADKDLQIGSLQQECATLRSRIVALEANVMHLQRQGQQRGTR